MSDLASTDKNLTLIFEEKPNLIIELVAQLNKDLNTDQFSVEDKTLEGFLKKIEYILKAERSSLAALLYRIDVEEDVALHQENYQTLSLAVLIREAQKVSFRKMFGS